MGAAKKKLAVTFDDGPIRGGRRNTGRPERKARPCYFLRHRTRSEPMAADIEAEYAEGMRSEITRIRIRRLKTFCRRSFVGN